MRQKIPALIISLLIAIYLAEAINKVFPDEPQPAAYDTTVTLTGTLTREFDMSFVGSVMPPVKDPDAADNAAAAAQRSHPAASAALRAPIPHLILHLDKPLSLGKGADDGLHPAESDITEIDLGDIPYGKFHIYADALGRAHFAVTGVLWHARSAHHLRALVLEAADIRVD